MSTQWGSGTWSCAHVQTGLIGWLYRTGWWLLVFLSNWFKNMIVIIVAWSVNLLLWRRPWRWPVTGRVSFDYSCTGFGFSRALLLLHACCGALACEPCSGISQKSSWDVVRQLTFLSSPRRQKNIPTWKQHKSSKTENLPCCIFSPFAWSCRLVVSRVHVVVWDPFSQTLNIVLEIKKAMAVLKTSENKKRSVLNFSEMF